MFPQTPRFVITARRSESRGQWPGGSRRAILRRALQMAVESSAYSSWSARCLAAQGISPICEQAGSAASTVSGPIVASPIACIVTSADWCASSGMNSATQDRLPCLLQVHRSCAASGRSCQKIVRISYPTRSRIRRHRCDGFACALQPQKLQAELAARLLISCTSDDKSGFTHSRTSTDWPSRFARTSATAGPSWCESVSPMRRLSSCTSPRQISCRADKPRTATISRKGGRRDLPLPVAMSGRHGRSNTDRALSCVRASPASIRALALRGQA